MNREQAVAVFDRKKGINPGAIEQRAPKRGASMIEGEAGGQHHGDAAAGADKRECAFEKELVEIRVAIALPPVDARVPRERRQRFRITGRSPFATQHLPRRVPDNGVEPRSRLRASVGIVKDLRKLERPVEEQLVPGNRGGLFKER